MMLHTRASRRRVVTVRTEYWAKPIPTRAFDWSAVDDQRYDGADDAGPQHCGYGETEEQAIADLMAQIEDDED